jgi:hypothetical protein
MPESFFLKMSSTHSADGPVIRADPGQSEVFVEIVQINHRYCHPAEQAGHGMICWPAENTIPAPRSQPGRRRRSQFVLLNENRPAMMRAQVTGYTCQNPPAVSD